MAASSSTAAASFGSWSASTVSASAANARSRSRSQRTSYRRAATSQSSAGCGLSACPSSERPADPARQHPCWPAPARSARWPQSPGRAGSGRRRDYPPSSGRSPRRPGPRTVTSQPCGTTCAATGTCCERSPPRRTLSRRTRTRSWPPPSRSWPPSPPKPSSRTVTNSRGDFVMTAAEQRPTTTNAGVPVASDEHSLTQGTAGGILLQDHYLVEKMAQFNRERVPERVVHAKGAGAFGEFIVTDDVSAYTKADFLQPGKKTEMLARFSSVATEQGGADTQRDPRGFALKFYTEQGNYDLVGNDTPVFFVKDPMKFQDFIRSQKRLPDSGLRSNDMQWDFWTLSPESAHQVTWLMGDRGLPRTLRHMDGFGSHAYQWINAAGGKCWVKYTFKTDQGNEFLTQQEGDYLAGTSPDHYRKDLFGSIEDGDFPSWTLYVQIMALGDAEGYRFHPFDLTKVWPHLDYPLIRVGTMTLNRNPENFFAQIEQSSFEPSNFVPGINTSPDKMLLGRLFSYADAHRYRIGTNYTQLPVNAPKSSVNSYSKEGSMRYRWNDPSIPVYAPNSHGGPHADTATYDDGAGWSAGGDMVHSPYILHAEDDDWGQAGTLVREVLDDAARARLVGNICGHLLNGVTEPVLERAFQYWHNVDADLGKKVEEAVRAGQGGSAPTTAQTATTPGSEAAKV